MKTGRALIVLLVSAGLFLPSCNKYAPQIKPEQQRKVFLLYADGFNNLKSYMQSDVAALENQAPQKGTSDFAKLLVFAHYTHAYQDYNVPTSPFLLDIYKDEYGKVVRDTVKKWPAGTHTSTAAMITEVLTLVRDSYPAAEYGFSYSSHGTGWIPERYYDTHPSAWTLVSRRQGGDAVAAAVQDENYRTLTGPAEYKSIGCEPTDATLKNILEMSVKDFAAAIPLRADGSPMLDYLILDACLMGGVETMYQLRDKARYILSSQTEIKAGGFYYENMLNRIFYTENTDLEAICKDYMGSMTEATVSLVDCSALDGLAQCCDSLFGKYSAGIAAIKPNQVQGFFTKNKHWYYDLEDILIHGGMDRGDSLFFRENLNACVLYTDHSSHFDTTTLKRDCGMSMCLPCNAAQELKDYYIGQYEWNKATNLITQ